MGLDLILGSNRVLLVLYVDDELTVGVNERVLQELSKIWRENEDYYKTSLIFIHKLIEKKIVPFGFLCSLQNCFNSNY